MSGQRKSMLVQRGNSINVKTAISKWLSSKEDLLLISTKVRGTSITYIFCHSVEMLQSIHGVLLGAMDLTRRDNDPYGLYLQGVEEPYRKQMLQHLAPMEWVVNIAA